MRANANNQSTTTNARALVLDIDNTLTPPRRPLESDMAQVLCNLTVPFFLGAGGDLRLVTEQFVEPLHEFGYRGSFDAFLCNGPTRYRIEIGDSCSVRLLRDFRLRDHVGEQRFQHLLRTIDKALNLDEFRLPNPMRVLGDRIVDRGSMINVAPIGRPRVRLTDEAHANRDAFTRFDAQTGFRQRFLRHLTQELKDLSSLGLCITLGGETSFDIVIRGNDKSFPLRTLISEGFQRVWYVGDALFEGGNDQAVLDFIRAWPPDTPCPVEAIPVTNWRQTKGALEGIGAVAPMIPSLHAE